MPRRPAASRSGSPPQKPARRRASKAERWLNLLAFLLDHHYPVPREDIFLGVADYRRDWVDGNKSVRESVRRKFERDKKELKALGIPIQPEGKVFSEHADQEVDCYRLKPRDLYLPYVEIGGKARPAARPYALPALSLKAEEFTLLRRAAERVQALEGTGLGASAASALRKLSFDLPELEPGDGELSLRQPVNKSFAQLFGVLRAGVERHLPVACRYYSIGRDADEEREIEPYGLMLSWGNWYCIARAPEKDAMRVFRLSRMRDAVLQEGVAPFTVPEQFSVRDYLDRSPWELGEGKAVAVKVRIAFPHSRWVLAEGLGNVLEGTDEAGGALLQFEVRAMDAFVRWLLTFGPQVEVVEPPEVGDRLTAERDRLRALYR
jgi:predicted DNA-binding transcriptional regulator YafY